MLSLSRRARQEPCVDGTYHCRCGSFGSKDVKCTPNVGEENIADLFGRFPMRPGSPVPCSDPLATVHQRRSVCFRVTSAVVWGSGVGQWCGRAVLQGHFSGGVGQWWCGGVVVWCRRGP